MTQTGYSNAIVNVMLGWLKGLATWVLKLFNLAGSGGNPLLWLSENWLKLLIVLLVFGLVMDWLIWMIRWRPYWVWFRKKRIMINDEKFLAGEEFEEVDTGDVDDTFERDYVVPSTVVRRSPRAGAQASRASTQTPRRTVPREQAQYGGRTPSTIVKRRPQQSAPARRVLQKNARRDIFSEDFFELGQDRQEYSDFYEDEVFNVSNLPDSPDSDKKGRKKRR